MEFFTDKYGAKTMADCKQILGVDQDIQHTIIYGPNGSGKFTLANAWLAEKFGVKSTQLKRKTWDCVLPNRPKPITVNMMHSQVHDILDPTGWGQQDRNVLNKYLKELCLAGGTGTISQFLQKPKQKILMVRHTEVLTENAQQNLRFLMDEMQSTTCSVILLTSTLFKLHPGIVSRCQIVKRETDPTKIEKVLLDICTVEDITMKQTENTCRTIANDSLGDWRHALSALQMLSLNFDGQASVVQAATQKLLCNLNPHKTITDDLVTDIRKDAYMCLAVCGAHQPGGVLKSCVKELSDKVSSKELSRVVDMAWNSDMLMCRGSRPVMHIERFLMLLWESGIADNYVKLISSKILPDTTLASPNRSSLELPQF